MELGTRYETIEEVVTMLESRLGIVMREHDDAETGVSFWWASDLDAKNGVKYYAVDVRPTRSFDPEENEYVLGHRDWEGYTFVIGISDELTAEIAKIRELIAQGVLKAEEIPAPAAISPPP